jgi:hypothetical protein
MGTSHERRDWLQVVTQQSLLHLSRTPQSFRERGCDWRLLSQDSMTWTCMPPIYRMRIYMYAPCREKIWTVAGPEFGSDSGCVMVVVGALLAQVLRDIVEGYVGLKPNWYWIHKHLSRPGCVDQSGFQAGRFRVLRNGTGIC